MPAIRRVTALLAILAVAGPASAVGMGPLEKSGVTNGPRKAFYLTVINPYPEATTFEAYAVGIGDEDAQPRVRIVPEQVTVGGRQNRKIIVIAGEMEPGETYAFRVCAAKAEIMEGMIHARVCSKLSARRIAARV